jgi:hypothetical protein
MIMRAIAPTQSRSGRFAPYEARKAVWNPAQRSCSAAAHTPCYLPLQCRPVRAMHLAPLALQTNAAGTGTVPWYLLRVRPDCKPRSARVGSALQWLALALRHRTSHPSLSPLPRAHGAARKPVVLLSGQRKSRLASCSEI